MLILNLLDSIKILMFCAVLGYTIGEEIQTRDYASPVNVLEEEVQAREYVAPRHAEEIDTVDKYSIPEPQYSISESQYDITESQYSITEPQYSISEPQQVSEADEKLNEIPLEESVASFPPSVTMVRDPPPSSTGEPMGERPKLTYASIVSFLLTPSILLCLSFNLACFSFTSLLYSCGYTGSYGNLAIPFLVWLQ